MPSKEHDRTAGETEKIIRSQLWQGGFYWGNWGQTEEGIKCRQSEGIDRQSRSGTVTREAPDGSLWIDELSPRKPMLVIEVAVSEPYDHVRDKCEIWLTQHEGFIKFAVAINIEKWKHKEEKQAAALKEEQVALMLAAGNRKRKPSDEAGPSDPGKRPKSGDAVPRVQEVYDDDDDELTDIEDLEVFTPDSPEDPTPITHKFRRATVSVFRSARVNRHRVMQTVINQMPVWPEPPSEMWKLSWNDMDVSMPDSHKDKIFEVTFEALHEFLAKELLRDPPPVEGSWGWHPDSQVSTSSSGLSSVPDQVWDEPGDPPPS